ncbi:MAG: NAD+ synthase, partial [Candidatus Geothermarchaeales archaeon]
VNPTMGDLEGNAELVRDHIKDAREKGADVVMFPEMVMTGYPPLDLLPPREAQTADIEEHEPFAEENKRLLLDLIRETEGISGIVGFVDFGGTRLYNAAAVFSDGQLLSIVHKTLLPTYDVFDEVRYFTPADSNQPLPVPAGEGRIRVGVSICEDLWDEALGYETRVTDSLAKQGAEILVNINASPFYVGKRFVREGMLRRKAESHRLPVFYVNMVGGQDELVFDGQSLAFDSRGDLLAIGKQFEEDLVIVDLETDGGRAAHMEPPPYDREEEMFNALVLGLRDYMGKTGFKKAVVALSGGIDSSLTACVGAESVSPSDMLGVYMPSRFSSDHSEKDSRRLAQNLGMGYEVIPIDDLFRNYEKTLESHFEGTRFGTAEENIQARIRGNILMALSNKFGYLVLSTGNKTELALGYCTLYGDMTGGLAVIGDVSKTDVYALADYYNRRRGRDIIPRRCFKKRPSAELRLGQYDPFDYDVVSPLVEKIIQQRKSKEELLQEGYTRDVVQDAIRRMRRAEYKRRQAAPTIKITRKAFGIGWRMPIVNKYTPQGR